MLTTGSRFDALYRRHPIERAVERGDRVDTPTLGRGREVRLGEVGLGVLVDIL
jgi:hypothetical protein